MNPTALLRSGPGAFLLSLALSCATLVAQAQDRYDGALAIEYLQRGPTEWRLRLVRTTPPV